jgi:hypothetical protein
MNPALDPWAVYMTILLVVCAGGTILGLIVSELFDRASEARK